MMMKLIQMVSCPLMLCFHPQGGENHTVINNSVMQRETWVKAGWQSKEKLHRCKQDAKEMQNCWMYSSEECLHT